MITNKDLLKEISLQELVELSDLNATGSINQEVIDDALNDAISFIESFIFLPMSPTPLLKKITVDFTIYELKRKNSLVSEADKELKKENEGYLQKMSTGRLKTSTKDTSEKKATSFAFRHKKSRKVDTRGFR